MVDAIELVECKSAKEFVEKVVLAPQAGRIFRGLPDAQFDLVPSIARPEVLKKISSKPGAPPIIDGVKDLVKRRVICYEKYLCSKFYQSAYNSGIELPIIEDWVHFNMLNGSVALSDTGYIPSQYGSFDTHCNYWPVLARMQHLGIPTRLLDWTTVPAHAVFFSAFQQRRDASSLAVWSLPTNFLAAAHGCSSVRWDSLGVPSNLERRTHYSDALIVYSPPTDSNKNMKSQSGVFTISVNNNIKSNSSSFQDISGADAFDQGLLFEYIFHEWENVEGPPYGVKQGREPAFCYTVSSDFTDDIMEILSRMGIAEFRVLSEGFAYGEILNRSERSWLNSETWVQGV